MTASDPVHEGRIPAGIDLIRAGAIHFAQVALFRYRMFDDIDPDVDHSAEKDAYLAAFESYLERHAADPGQVIFLAVDTEAGDIPVGCAAMIVEDRPPRLGQKPEAYGYIHNVYVLPPYRGRGIARALVQRLHDESRVMRVRRIGLHASGFGAPVYEGLGYRHSHKYLEYELHP